MVPQHVKRSFKVPWRPIWITFWEKTTPETKKGSHSSKNFIGQNFFENQKSSLVKNFQLWFSEMFCQMKFFDPRYPFLVLALWFLKWLSRLAFKKPISMLVDHCLTSIQFSNICPYSGLFGLYGLWGQIPAISWILTQNDPHKAKKIQNWIKWRSPLFCGLWIFFNLF